MLRACSPSKDLQERTLGLAVTSQDTPPGDQESLSTSDLHSWEVTRQGRVSHSKNPAPGGSTRLAGRACPALSRRQQ